MVTIFLDEERFLEEAIESVLSQTYREWELLLCDDGSTDGSTRIARDYAKAHPGRIRYLEHPGHRNRGMSATRNLGIAHARGEYVALLDGDDVMLPEKLVRQVASLDACPEAAMVYGPTVWWSSWSSGDPDDDVKSDLGVRAPAVVPGDVVLRRILQRRGDPMFTCSPLMRRSAVLRVGGFEERFTGLFEDQAFFSKMLLAYEVLVVSDVLDLYRQHPDSCCAVARQEEGDGSLLAARQDYTRWLRAYVSDQGARPRVRWAVAFEDTLQRVPAVARAVIAARVGLRRALGPIVRGAFAASRWILPRAVRSGIWRLIAGPAARPPERS